MSPKIKENQGFQPTENDLKRQFNAELMQKDLAILRDNDSPVSLMKLGSVFYACLSLLGFVSDPLTDQFFYFSDVLHDLVVRYTPFVLHVSECHATGSFIHALEHINAAISALWRDNDCSSDALPNHILVPVEQFGALVTRKVSDDSERSILTYVLENNLSVQQGGELVISPPNAPVTLSGGWIYNRVAKKGVLVGGKSGSTSMKDTEALYNDFDWEITGR